MADFTPFHGWAFAWRIGARPWICPMVYDTRSQVIQAAEQYQGRPWRKIYRDGGRAVRVVVEAREPRHD